MLRQKPWNMSEAVVLLEGLLLYKSNRISKKEAICLVSVQLRKMAENSGCAIDDVFRNTNGIAFQMSSMESALAGHTIMKPATRLFAKTVEIYYNDQEIYMRILEEAKRVINDTNDKCPVENTVNDSYDLKPQLSDAEETSYAAVIRETLACKFVRGYRLGSVLELKMMRKYLETQSDGTLDLSDEELERLIKDCGIRYKDKIFLPDAMLPAVLRNKLFTAIRDHLFSGKSAVYYEALFKEFSDEFLDYLIYDADMLKAYIAFYNDGEYHLGSKFISKDLDTQADPIEEVKNYLVAMGQPINSSEICVALIHIPQKKVIQILGMNAEFVNNGKSFYFHVDMVHLTETDLESISSTIANEIAVKQFVSGNELKEILSAKYPHIMERNSFLSMMGLRDALKYYLRDKFSFKGNVISDLNHAISMEWVFGNYASTHASFTRAELKQLASEMNTIIYLDAVYDNSLRISKDQFISKEYAQFRIEDTDRALERFCNGACIPLRNIQEFGSFPDAGYPWTSFLLEHFAYAYSQKFKILHAGFNVDCCVGAIVRKDAGIESFNDLLSIVLGESDVPLKKEDALSFCVKSGYLARRRYSDIEMILIQANTYRNKKGTN